MKRHDMDAPPLFSFIGDGAVTDNGPFPDWVYWDDLVFDLQRSQERESRVFADILSRLVDTTVAPA